MGTRTQSRRGRDRSIKCRQRTSRAMRRLAVETLESRTLLSATVPLPANWQATPIALPHFLAGSDDAGSTTPSGLAPNQVRGAYGLGTYAGGVLSNGITFDGIQGDGSGQTIAIVDAYDDPNAASDLNAFSNYFGLPTFGGAGNPTFARLNQRGGTTLPGTDPNGPWHSTGNSTWELEESLDIEWAHAMAPMANIILFEASNASNGLYTAVQTAAHTPGVVAISMSWGGSEFDGETSCDSNYFVTPAGHLGGAASTGGADLPGGVTFLAAAGDSGAFAPDTMTITPNYPASSPNVVAVGGTSLTVDGTDYVSESGWGYGDWSGLLGGGGGGISANERQPSYQSGVVSTFSTTRRTYPDVAADADPNTGVALYDSWDFGQSTPWLPGALGGTSLACPLWAGMIAVADEGRAIGGLGSLDGPSQTLPALYSLPATDFHDITSGGNGPSPTYDAGSGYDLATGIGSPVGNLLLPQLVNGPGVTQPAAASPSPVIGTTTSLSVLGADAAGESTLTYTWAATTIPAGAAAPLFSANGTNAAKDITATFSRAGSYAFQVTITDQGGLSTTSSVTVTVNSVFSTIVVSPATTPVEHGKTEQLTATAKDQFNVALGKQPAFTWKTTVGKIGAKGLFTAPVAAGSCVVTATSGTIHGTGDVTVVNQSSVLAGIEASPLPYAPQQAATAVTSTLAVSDADSPDLARATIAVGSGYQKGSDVLAFKNTAKIRGKWNAATGTLTLSGSDTVADYQAALRAVTYRNTSAGPTAGARTVTFQVNDGSTNSNSLSRTIQVSASASALPAGQAAGIDGLILAAAAPGDPPSLSAAPEANRSLFAGVANWLEPSG